MLNRIPGWKARLHNAFVEGLKISLGRNSLESFRKPIALETLIELPLSVLSIPKNCSYTKMLCLWNNLQLIFTIFDSKSSSVF